MVNGTQDSQPQLPEVITRPQGWLRFGWKPIPAVGGAIIFIYQGFKLYREDQRTITWITLSVLMALVIVFLMNCSFSRIQDEHSKRPRYPRVYKWARVGLVLALVLTGFGAWWVWKTHRDSKNKVVVVLAELDGAKLDVTNAIEGLKGLLEQQARDGDRILIRQPGSSVRDEHGARSLGKDYGGRLVIWFRVESKDGEDRILIELHELEPSSETTGGGPRTVSNVQASANVAQIQTRAPYLAGYAKYEAENYVEAIDLFTRALSEGDWQRDQVGVGYAYFLRGNCFYFSRKFQEAVDDYSKAIEGNPGLVQAYFNRGLALSEQHKDEDAILDYTEAIRLVAGDPGAYNNRGLSYAELADSKRDNSFYELALKDFDDAVRISPQYAEAYSSRGDANSNLAAALSEAGTESSDVLNQSQKYFNRALADYSKSIDLKPDKETYNNRASTYYELKNYDRAIADCTSAAQLDSKYAPAFYNRGRAFYQQKHYLKAIDDFSWAYTLDSQDPDILYNRAAASFELAKSERDSRQYYEIALADYNTILAGWPKSMEAYWHRGVTLVKLGRCNEAIKDFKKALESDDEYTREQAQDWLRSLALGRSSECEAEKVN